jgi:hypothetical protein
MLQPWGTIPQLDKELCSPFPASLPDVAWPTQLPLQPPSVLLPTSRLWPASHCLSPASEPLPALLGCPALPLQPSVSPAQRLTQSSCRMQHAEPMVRCTYPALPITRRAHSQLIHILGRGCLFPRKRLTHCFIQCEDGCEMWVHSQNVASHLKGLQCSLQILYLLHCLAPLLLSLGQRCSCPVALLHLQPRKCTPLATVATLTSMPLLRCFCSAVQAAAIICRHAIWPSKQGMQEEQLEINTLGPGHVLLAAQQWLSCTNLLIELGELIL